MISDEERDQWYAAAARVAAAQTQRRNGSLRLLLDAVGGGITPDVRDALASVAHHAEPRHVETLAALLRRPAAHEGGRDLDMDLIVQILRDEHGVPAYVEQTGGGVATIYAGQQRPEDGLWAAVAGPGWFQGRGPGHYKARAAAGDFYVGPDDQGERTPTALPDNADEYVAAQLIATQANLPDPSLPLTDDDLTAAAADRAASRLARQHRRLAAAAAAKALPDAAVLVFDCEQDTVSARNLIALVHIRDAAGALLWYYPDTAFAAHPDARALGTPPSLAHGVLEDIEFHLTAAYNAVAGHFESSADGGEQMPWANLLALPVPPAERAVEASAGR